ncbi:MAG: hypothetical protein AAGA96_11415 [Verrucomicrobiota bacterium]
MERHCLEALYDLEKGDTYVRHPSNPGEWVEVSLLEKIGAGKSFAAISSHSTLRVYESEEGESEVRKIVLVTPGKRNLLKG